MKGQVVPPCSSFSLALKWDASHPANHVAPKALDPDAKRDHRADLYAVGVMLYQMPTGRISQENFKDPSEVDHDIDPRLDAIVRRVLQSDPDDRYPSAAAVRADIDLISG